jgi:Trk K+ transport system NAD-binding subunit
VVLTAPELNPNLLIVARAEDDRSEGKLLHAGATRVVSPYVIGGRRMAHSLLRPAVLDVIDIATHYRSIELQIEEVTVAKSGFAEGGTLQESGIREALGIIVIAIKKPTDEMLFNPKGEVRIEAGDRLVVMGADHESPRAEVPASGELPRVTRPGGLPAVEPGGDRSHRAISLVRLAVPTGIVAGTRHARRS